MGADSPVSGGNVRKADKGGAALQGVVEQSEPGGKFNQFQYLASHIYGGGG